MLVRLAECRACHASGDRLITASRLARATGRPPLTGTSWRSRSVPCRACRTRELSNCVSPGRVFSAYAEISHNLLILLLLLVTPLRVVTSRNLQAEAWHQSWSGRPPWPPSGRAVAGPAENLRRWRRRAAVCYFLRKTRHQLAAIVAPAATGGNGPFPARNRRFPPIRRPRGRKKRPRIRSEAFFRGG